VWLGNGVEPPTSTTRRQNKMADTTKPTEDEAYHLMCNFFELLKLDAVDEAYSLLDSRSVEEIEHAAEGLLVTAGVWKLMALAMKMKGAQTP
jgi:hypothetical protein